MVGPSFTRSPRLRDNWETYARESYGFRATFENAPAFSRWGCPATTPALRPVLDRLVARIEEVGARDNPGWIVEIGCEDGQWTEWIAMTMKSLHTEPGAPRQQLAVLDASPTALQTTTEYLEARCLAVPSAMRICHNGRFQLDGPADLVFSFDTLAQYPLELIRQYFESVAQALKPGGRFLVSLACPKEKDAAGNDAVEPAAFVSADSELTFAEPLRDVVEHYFTLVPEQPYVLSIQPRQVFFELIRKPS